MRLLIDCHIFDGAFQGTRTYIEGIYKNLVKHDDIEFFFAAENLSNIKKLFGEADHVHYIKLGKSNKFYRLGVEYPRIIKEYRIDYAHFLYISPLFKNCKEIVTCCDLLFLDMPQYFPLSYRLQKKILFKRSAKRADILLSISDFAKDEIVRHFGIESSKIDITPCAVLPVPDNFGDQTFRKEHHLDKYLLTVSRVESRKNHISLLKAFVDLKLYENGYHLVMAGSPDIGSQEFADYLNALPAQIKEKVVMKSVSFPALVDLYRNASLFVFPSYGEGFGIPPLEAVEYGCPLLCSNATAMAEFGLPEEIMFDPYDYETMRSKILQELEHPTDLTIVRKQIKEKYNWVKIADDFYDLLKNKCM